MYYDNASKIIQDIKREGKVLKKILIVTGDFVYPPNHGGRVDVWNRILVLHEMGFWIHLICTVKKRPEPAHIKIVEDKVQRLSFALRKNRAIDMIYGQPLQMVSRKSLESTKLEDKYDFLLLEGTYVYRILSNSGLHADIFMLRMHNNESVYFSSLANAEHSLLRKFYYWVEAKKFRRIDRKIIQKVPNILFISHSEKEYYEKRYESIHGCFLPASVQLNFKKRARNNHTALLIASFFMENNREAIRFYLEKIHPLIKIPDYQIIIAGNSRKSSIDWLIRLTSPYKNVRIYDSPENLQPLYEISSVFINSMLNGAGVKLKTINAIVEGLPVISTTVGNEGTGLHPEIEILVADDAKDISRKIEQLLLDKKKADFIISHAQEYVRKHGFVKLSV